ncbi:MAG: hypothetical protein K2X08_04840 [Chlamydiales bacterium]|nr:hypothetical protein [Chlamydiales bacterium]
MKRLTKGFHLTRLDVYNWNSCKAPNQDYVNPPVEQEILELLSQPFIYLNRGAQCYVFESQDRKYVIKFFQKRKKKIKKIDFTSCLIAYYKAKKETALLYIHLIPTQQSLPKLSVRSPLGTWFSLSLDRYAFVIQKKTKPFRETLLQASKEKTLDIYLSSLLDLLNQRIAKGIRNKDLSLSSNFGFLGEQAVEFDFGCYMESVDFLQTACQTLEKTLFINQLRFFMEANLPDDLDLFEKLIQNQVY